VTLPTSIQAYSDCYDVFERAKADPVGIRVWVGEREKDAVYLRSRMHYYRSLLRDQNAILFPKGHPMHGCCEYDVFVLRPVQDTEGDWWLYIEANIISADRIESLSEASGDET